MAPARVYVWQASSLEEATPLLSCGEVGVDLEEIPVVWRRRRESLTQLGDDQPLHMVDDAENLLARSWLGFSDLCIESVVGDSLATTLDYARFYGLRTLGVVRGGCPSPRPEYLALDLILAESFDVAEQLQEKWRLQNLDVRRLPAIRTLPGVEESSARGYGVGDILKSTPPLARLVAVSGSLGSSIELWRTFASLGVDLKPLQWSQQVSALIPDASPHARVVEGIEICRGDWAVLSLSSCCDCAEAMEIVDEAQGLGLKVAVIVSAAKFNPKLIHRALDKADLALFALKEDRDATLSAAFRGADKIATLRARWRVAADEGAVLAEIRASSGRINRSGRLDKLRRIFYLKDESAAKGFRSELEGAFKSLGVEAVSLGWDSEGKRLTAVPRSDSADLSSMQDEAPETFQKDWLLIGDGAPAPPAGLLEASKAAGMRLAVLCASDSSLDRDRLKILSGADAILPTTWRVAAGLIRGLELSGSQGSRILTCMLSHDGTAESARTSLAIDWRRQAPRLLEGLDRAGAPPGWSLSSISGDMKRPLLTCAITTYNRAPWLKHSLKILLDAAAPWRDKVEIVVCDNASTDDTPSVVEKLRESYSFQYYRNDKNVGMLGNLGATARHCSGAFVWIIGDDDLVVDEGLEIILKAIEENPDVEMVYLNYGYTHFSQPDTLSDPRSIIDKAAPIGFGGENRRVERLADVAAYNENLFTAIYACVFRRDHALRAYQLDNRGAPFSSLATCVPSSVYALQALQDRPAYWVGFPAIVVNMNVSWMRWALLWHLERMPDLHDLAELSGVDPARIDRHRFKHCWNAGEWVREAYFEAEQIIRDGFSMARLIERCKHIEIFRAHELEKAMRHYQDAWNAGLVTGDCDAPEALIERYGLPAAFRNLTRPDEKI
jgi:hypothetical protein